MKLLKALATRNKKLVDILLTILLYICSAMFFIGIFIFYPGENTLEQDRINLYNSYEDSMLDQPETIDQLDYHDNIPQKDYDAVKDSTGDYSNMEF